MNETQKEQLPYARALSTVAIAIQQTTGFVVEWITQVQDWLNRNTF